MISKTHPIGPLKRLWYGLFRLGSKRFRANNDLFYDAYEVRAGWESGLGNGAQLLYSMVRLIQPEVVVEIGSARGKSTCCLALACKDNGRGKVYAIDPHMKNPWSDHQTTGDNLEFLLGKVKAYGLQDQVEVIRAISPDAAKGWNRPIDLIFIDGDHTYEGVKADFELFQPFFSEKALVVFHDTTWNYSDWEKTRAEQQRSEEMGVPIFMDELRKAGYQSITFNYGPGITIFDPRVGGHDFLAGKGWPAMQNNQR